MTDRVAVRLVTRNGADSPLAGTSISDLESTAINPCGCELMTFVWLPVIPVGAFHQPNADSASS